MLSNIAGKRRIPEHTDVLIIGGGIVGSGVARDAALRGLRTVLVEKNDFASGTSSRSSRLLHGGIRYLAQGRLGLVREASAEKMVIHRIAPHLSSPLPFIFPTRKSGHWKYWQLRLGTKIYDLLCGGRNLGRSSRFSRGQILELIPDLNPDGLTGAVRYFDGLTNDARLVMDTLRSAAHAGATVCNYARFNRAKRNGESWQCEISDDLTGADLAIETRCIVNAAGAWSGEFPESGIKLRLTKGVHLVIDRTRLPVPDAVVMTEGKRILFAIPWGQRIILGTTDTDYAGPTDSPTCTTEDISYILKVTNATFTSANLAPADVISGWSGLRPLIADPSGKPSEISRRHKIDMTEPGWFDVAGGKLTTYRLMAEQTLDRILKHARMPARPCLTASKPLLAGLPVGSFSGILPPRVCLETVEHYCRQEWAIHLSDVMVRRTSWRHYHKNHLEIAEQAAKWMSASLGWDSATSRRELDQYCLETDLAPAIDYQSETPGSFNGPVAVKNK